MALNVEAFYDAINNIALKQVQASPADLTIDVEISKMYNPELGEYKVEYQGNIFSVFSSDPEVTYNQGERVYVLVPGGDFSRRKVILGRSEARIDVDDPNQQDLMNYFIPFGPNWLSEGYYEVDHEPLRICSCPSGEKSILVHDNGQKANYEDQGFRRWSPKDEKEEIIYGTRYPAGYFDEDYLAGVDALFTNFAKSCSWIMLSAKFRTEFMSTHNNGKYSLKATFIQDNPKYKDKNDPQYNQRKDEPQYIFSEYELGFLNFSGAPYSFSVNTPQKAYYEIPSGQLKGLYKLSLVQDGQMSWDIVPHYNANGELEYLIEDKVNGKNNIFCTDMVLQFCKKVNLLDNPYYCYIEFPQGDSVYDKNGDIPGRGSVTLIPHLMYRGKDVTSDCIVEWFREDMSIPSVNNPGEADKDQWGRTWDYYTGVGWRPISQYAEQEYNTNYIGSSDNSLTVLKDGVIWQWRFKVVCKYKNADDDQQAFGTAVGLVKRADSKYDLYIEETTTVDNRNNCLRITDGNALVGREINPVTKKVYPEWFGEWYYELPDGSVNLFKDMSDGATFIHGPIAIQHLAIYKFVRFKAAAYDPKLVNPPNGDYNPNTMKETEEIGYVEYELNFTDGEIMIEWDGEKHFNYTAAGKCYDSAARADHTLAVKINWDKERDKGSAIDYDVTILSPDGKVLGDLAYYNTNDGGETGQVSMKGAQPANSMMYDIYTDSQDVVHFKVKSEWNSNCLLNNTFIARIYTARDGKWYEMPCEVTFTKDGQSGTQGSAWTAPLDLTNSSTIRGMQEVNDEGDVMDGYAAAPFTERLNVSTYPLVLRRVTGENNQYRQVTEDSYNRVFIRPFVTKEGWRLEQKNQINDEKSHYRIKVYWDVRTPGTFVKEAGQKASFLRLYQGGQPLTPGIYDGGDSGVNPQGALGLFGTTEWRGDDDSFLANQYYNAVEVRYETGAGLGLIHEDVGYRFVVKAQIDVLTDLPTEFLRKGDTGYFDMQEGAGAEGWHRLKSISAFYPIDLFILDDGEPVGDKIFNPMRASINWPTEVIMDAAGYNPQVMAENLEFYYGFYPDAEVKTQGTWVEPESWIPTIQEVRKEELDFAVREEYLKAVPELSAIGNIPEYVYTLKPRSHLNWMEGSIGILVGRIERPDDPEDAERWKTIPQGLFMRNQVYHVNQYENVDINSWDGQGIDINEDNGTIFAPTIGAGFKGPYTNTFTGVLMGVNTAYKRQTTGIIHYAESGIPNDAEERELESYPYMTGLFGYQQGHASFGLLENGTAFFGRKDRGGRIIIDGYNATIYGGANGELSSPKIGDPMWNNMRLNFVDLTHSVANADLKPAYFTGIQDVDQGFDGDFFKDPAGYNATISENQLPGWYMYCWRHAYIKPDGKAPWWLKANYYNNYDDDNDLRISKVSPGDYFKAYSELPVYLGQELNGEQNFQINYYDGINGVLSNSSDSLLGLTEEEAKKAAQPPTNVGFGASRASTTPAIEIGQHQKGLMPGILPWGSAEFIMTHQLQIPGNRNFMVTYDGTMWCMNGVFMGNVIGSNIVGGRLQGTQLGIGALREGEHQVERVIGDCNWAQLLPAPTKIFDLVVEEGMFGAFSVDSDGNVACSTINIYGGSIDIGSFHILGKATGTNEYGKLMQYGESDFIGPVHFYGNIGIGPNLRADQGNSSSGGGSVEKSREGNLFQTNGVAALGIIFPDSNTKWHAKFAQTDGSMQLNGVDYRPGLRSLKIGNPGIETATGTSIEQMAMFAVNTRSRQSILNIPEAAYSGHFWPMSYNYANHPIEDSSGEFPTDVAGVTAYLTTMNLFKSKAFSVSTTGGSGGAKEIEGGNYFRVGPWGVEMVRAYICQEFQDEDKCRAPTETRIEGSLGQAKGGVRGYIGLVNRSASGSSTNAIGITSYGKAPIIFNSDENIGIRMRGYLTMTGAQTDTANWKGGTERYQVTGVENRSISLCNMVWGNLLGADPEGRIELWSVGHFAGEGGEKPARIDIGILDFQYANENGNNNPYCTLEHALAGLALYTEGSYRMPNKEAGVALYSREGDIHIIRFNENNKSTQCTQAQGGITEVLLKEKDIVIYAEEKVTIGWGEKQSAHIKEENAWTHAAIFKDDGIRIINKGEGSDGSPGSGGGGSTPPTPAEAGDKKYCIFLGDNDNIGGNSEITWQTNFVGIAGKQVKISGGGSPAHSPTNYMLFAQSAIDMKGAYATPDNQFHIYARFG